MAKVVIIAPYVPYPARHGGAIRSRVLLDALRQDHTVHLAAAMATPQDRANAEALTAATGVVVHPLPAHVTPKSSALRKLRLWLGGGSELVGRRWQVAAREEMRRILAQVGPDLVVVDSTFALPVAPAGFQVLYLHNLEYSMYARREDAPRSLTDRITRRMEARGLRAVEQQAIEGAPMTVTVSEHDRDLAVGLVPTARVEVVPNSVDLGALPRLPAANPEAPPRLLFVGSLDYPPNLEAVTELAERHLPALRTAFPGLTVRLVGKDPAGVGQRFASVPGVEVVGPVDDVVEHYRDTHAVYLPIRSGGGTRIKILEAWALGVPVLSTAVGCEGLPAADGTHLRVFETPEQGCAALRQVLSGDGDALRANGRELVERQFSHAAAITRLRQLFRELSAQ